MGIRPRPFVLRLAAMSGNCGEGNTICEKIVVQGLKGTARPTSFGDEVAHHSNEGTHIASSRFLHILYRQAN